MKPAGALQMSSSDVLTGNTSDGHWVEDAREVRAHHVQAETETDDGFLAEAAKTDAAAFGELYERYYPRVYRYVYHRTGHRADAEDITALVFMKALEALSGYQVRQNGFAPWLFRIARNTVVDHYRRSRKQSSLDTADLQQGGADPVIHILGAERRAELRDLVQCLSVDQRDVVLMRYASDLSFGEIATAMNKNEPAIRMLLHRGLRKLKAVMEDG